MLPSSLYGLNLVRDTEAAVVVHRDGGFSQHTTCVPKMGNVGEAPKGGRQSCFPRTHFQNQNNYAQSYHSVSSLYLWWEVNDSSPEASPALSPTHGCPVGVCWCATRSARLSRFDPFLMIRRHKRSSWEGPRAFNYCHFTHTLGLPMVVLAPVREGTVAGGQGQPGSRKSGRGGILLLPALLWDVMVRQVKQQP